MCFSSTCPNNTSGIGADFFCQCDPVRIQLRNYISMCLEWVVTCDPILKKLNMEDLDAHIWQELSEYFTHE